ncbi:MAG: 50S ribosomal protein L18 [Candidatus Methylacidiphilales bacterium]|nr:50S ribosomal protein L18 [Candidatus Methylacidiphilales bacterium]
MKASKKTTKATRQRTHIRIRRKVVGTPARPRLAVSFTSQHIYAQIIDDALGKTLVGVSTTEKSVAGQNLRPNLAGAAKVGQLLAERAKAKQISQVVFDRGGFLYHGKVKALADAAREGGLVF